jgi:hypothetical protein
MDRLADEVGARKYGAELIYESVATPFCRSSALHRAGERAIG